MALKTLFASLPSLHQGLLFDVRFFQSVTCFLVNGLKAHCQQQGNYAEQGENDHREGIIVLGNLGTFNKACTNFAVLVKNTAYEQGYESKADVLNPEYKCVCRAYQFLRDNLGNAWPHG